MARRKSLRSQLYRAARDIGNVQAARGGKASYVKRVVRRSVYRTTNGIHRGLLKELGAVSKRASQLFWKVQSLNLDVNASIAGRSTSVFRLVIGVGMIPRPA
jgi:hypothetical protein